MGMNEKNDVVNIIASFRNSFLQRDKKICKDMVASN